MLGGDWTDGTMTDFKWRHFQGDVILWAVRWYCRYPISGTVAKLAMRQPFVLFKGLTFQKLCLPGAFRPG
ncbi:hypothetical protein ACX8ZQ_00350, partial [Acinetobacter baumannii]